MDEFVVRYAPSLTLFQILWARERGRRELLLAVANPTGDLPFAEYECEQIEACWGGARAQVLWREQGTRHDGAGERRLGAPAALRLPRGVRLGEPAGVAA
jgi:hypothetical protein